MVLTTIHRSRSIVIMKRGYTNTCGRSRYWIIRKLDKPNSQGVHRNSPGPERFLHVRVPTVSMTRLWLYV